MTTRTQTATRIVVHAFVFVRKARAAGATNVVTPLLFAEIAETLNIPGDAYSVRTCKTLARERAALMGETDLLGF